MKLVTLTQEGAKRFGTPKTVKMIAQAGFDAYDCTLCDMNRNTRKCDIFNGSDYKNWAREVKSVADDYGIPCTQTHSVFPTLTDLKNTENMLYQNERCMEISAMLGADIIVIHPGNNFDAKTNYEYLYSKLLPLAERYNLRIATENMWNKKDGLPHFEAIPAACGTNEDFAKHIDISANPRLVACVDIGHAEMKNSEGAANMIRKLGHDKVKALHVHDNDLIHDNHVFPFTGKIEWNDIISALKDIDYDGNFTFEADSTLARFPDELIPACYEMLEKIGRYFVSKLEK